MSFIGWPINPAPFGGSERDRKKNYKSHFWGEEHTDSPLGPRFNYRVCSACGVHSTTTLAEWPCGAGDSVPRVSDREFLYLSKQIAKKRKKSVFRRGR